MKALEGKVAIVTGANRGLGLEIAQKFAEAGASLTICARTVEPLDRAEASLRQLLGPGQDLLARRADVSSTEDAAALVEITLDRFGRLDILVNNAGIYGPKGPIEEVDWERWVRAIEVNLLGSVLMCRAVLPPFKKQGYGKIVQLSGGGATSPLPRISAYAASKAAIVRFVETLADEVREFGIDVNAIAPGALNTGMLKEVLTAGPEKVGRAFYDRAVKQQETGGTPLAAGAELAVFLASSQSDGLTGKLVSAVWDPWREFPSHLEDLQSTDVYTLRRIVPRERGMDWGNDE